MTAQALLGRPGMMGLRLVGARLPALSVWPRAPSMMMPTSTYSLSSGWSSSPANPSLSRFSWPASRSFCVGATNDSENPSPIESLLMESMEKKIKEHLNADSVVVKDAYGDGRHISIDVISSAFEGQSAVNRQRMVYKAIWEELQDRVHAVDQMTTRTPSEAASRK